MGWYLSGRVHFSIGISIVSFGLEKEYKYVASGSAQGCLMNVPLAVLVVQPKSILMLYRSVYYTRYWDFLCYEIFLYSVIFCLVLRSNK